MEGGVVLVPGQPAPAEAAIGELKAVEVPRLQDLEDEDVAVGGRGISSAYGLLNAFDRSIENVFRVYQYHWVEVARPAADPPSWLAAFDHLVELH